VKKYDCHILLLSIGALKGNLSTYHVATHYIVLVTVVVWYMNTHRYHTPFWHHTPHNSLLLDLLPALWVQHKAHTAKQDPQITKPEPKMQLVSHVTPNECIVTLKNKQLQLSCHFELLPKRVCMRCMSKTQCCSWKWRWPVRGQLALFWPGVGGHNAHHLPFDVASASCSICNAFGPLGGPDVAAMAMNGGKMQKMH